MASLAAHKQGKYWEYVDKLYSDTKNQGQDVLEKYAKELGLDLEQFKADLKDPGLLRDVRMNMEAGKKVGVSGTPTMFLNGRKINARDLEALKKEVDAELEAMKQLTDGGKSVEEARKERALSGGGVDYVEYVMERKPIEVDLSPPAPPESPKAAPEAVDKTVYQAEVFDFDPVKGPNDALVTIVECTDFQ